MRLTLKELELLKTASAYNGEQHKAICGKATLELIEYKQIEEKLGLCLNELIQMLINGIWAVGAIDSETKKPIAKCIEHFRVCGIRDNKIIIIDDILPTDKNLVVKDCVLCTTLDLDKYKKKCLSGWALTKEELK